MKFKNETQTKLIMTLCDNCIREISIDLIIVLIKVVFISVWLTICENEIGDEIKMKNKNQSHE